MIHSRNNVPAIYNTSRDFQAILRLFDVLLNVEKNDVDNMVSLVNADKCPSKYLPLLASYVGYDYDYALSYETNRLIIKYYPLMIKYRFRMIIKCKNSKKFREMPRKSINVKQKKDLSVFVDIKPESRR